jgi:hypothetical protein
VAVTNLGQLVLQARNRTGRRFHRDARQALRRHGIVRGYGALVDRLSVGSFVLSKIMHGKHLSLGLL